MTTVDPSETTAVMAVAREADAPPPTARTAEAIALLTPAEARECLGARYTEVLGDREVQPTRALLVTNVLEPFLRAIPDVVAGREGQEDSRRLAVELLCIGHGMSQADASHILLSRTEDPLDQDADPDAVRVPKRKTTLRIPGINVIAGERFLARLGDLAARNGGVWLGFATDEVLAEVAAGNPVAIVNAVAEIHQYAANATFRVKLNTDQLNILQAFFRTS